MNNFCLYSQGCCGSGSMVICLKETGLKRTAPESAAENYNNAHTKYPAKFSKDFNNKILFMYADPRNILLSALNNGENNAFIHSHSFYLDGDCNYFDAHDKTKIEQLLKEKYDPLKLEEHFKNWMNVKMSSELMMLKYEYLEDPKIYQKVLNFFEVEGEHKYPWLQRKSSYLNLPQEQQVDITSLFGNLLILQDSLLPCFVK